MDAVATLWGDVMDLLKTPVTKDLDLIHLFFLVGAVILAIIVWAIIMNTLRKGAEVVTG